MQFTNNISCRILQSISAYQNCQTVTFSDESILPRYFQIFLLQLSMYFLKIKIEY